MRVRSFGWNWLWMSAAWAGGAFFTALGRTEVGMRIGAACSSGRPCSGSCSGRSQPTWSGDTCRLTTLRGRLNQGARRQAAIRKGAWPNPAQHRTRPRRHYDWQEERAAGQVRGPMK
jgi:hypothetical protein